MKAISLTQGKVTLVDDSDFDFLMQWKWYAFLATNGQFYVGRKRLRAEGPGPSRIRMHRVLFIVPAGLEVDHINGDALDNRRTNLRLATRSLNNRNWHRRKPTHSGLPMGVKKEGRRFGARIRGKNYRYLGAFDTPEAAHGAYLEARTLGILQAERSFST